VKAVLVDVDGTLLTGRRSSEALFIRHLLRHGVLGPRQLGAAGWFMLRHGPGQGRHAFRKNKAYLTGLSLAEIAALAEAFTNEHLAPLVDQALLRRLEQHRTADARVLLLTGTPAFIAAPLARLIGADGWRAARYALKNDLFRAAPPTEHPLGANKVTTAGALCQEAGAELAEATAYADSIHDLPLLLAVGRPVAVRPDPRLRADANARGWEILDDPRATVARLPHRRATRT